MDMIADILLGAGALGAAVYCLVLARRLKRFTRLEDGMGGAIAVLSAQVDDMTRALQRAQTTAEASEAALVSQTARAEAAAERLSLMLAGLHDLPDAGTRADARPAPPRDDGPVMSPAPGAEAAARPAPAVPTAHVRSVEDWEEDVVDEWGGGTGRDDAVPETAGRAGPGADTGSPSAPQTADIHPGPQEDGAAGGGESGRRVRFVRRRPGPQAQEAAE